MSYTLEDLRKMNIIAPELAEASQRRAGPKFSDDLLAYRQARFEHLSKLRHLMTVPGPIPEQVTEKEVFVTARDGYRIRTIVYTPASSEASPGPLVILVHEGGWTFGDKTDEEFNARQLTRDLGVTCINIEYRLAPEYSFPTGINDCWDVTRWAASVASPTSVTLRADPNLGFIVGGSSAGGNIAAILAHLSRNTDLQPPVTGQWLSVPHLMDVSTIPEKYKQQFLSPFENDHDPVLPHVAVSSDSPVLKTMKVDLKSPLFAPLAQGNYPNDPSKPPMAKAFLQVSGLDPLRDHGLIYAQILEEEYGTPAKANMYPGYSHMFWSNWPEMEASRRFAEDMVQGFRWLLS